MLISVVSPKICFITFASNIFIKKRCRLKPAVLLVFVFMDTNFLNENSIRFEGEKNKFY